METVNHKCPQCNANLNYNPKIKGWKCDYCGGVFKLEDLKKNEEKFQKKEVKRKNEKIKENENTNDNVDLDEYYCEDCGARILADKNTSATFCVYCKNTAILKNRLTDKFSPSKIIPFNKTKDDAISAFKEVGKHKIFMPKEFTDPKNIEEITGIYIPFWLFSGKIDSKIIGKGNRISSWTTGDYNYTKTDTFHVERSGEIPFSKIPVDGSVRFNDAIMNSIEPFNYDELVDFNYSYLSGFLSEKYDVEANEAKKISIDRASKSAYEYLRRDINYSTFLTEDKENKIIEGNNEYVLLPVWMVNIKYKEKLYTFAMNGQTGKMIGDIPYSKNKAFKFWLIIFLITFAITALITYFA